MVYLRVTAEGCGDNGQALNDALEAPQVNPLQPGARDYAVAQRWQHYLQHRQQKQQWDRGEQRKGAEEEVKDSEGGQDTREKEEGKEVKWYNEQKEIGWRREGRYITVRVLGVWTGSGLDLKPDTHHTNAPGYRHAMELQVTSHSEAVNSSEESVEAALQVSNTEPYKHTHTNCVCEFKE